MPILHDAFLDLGSDLEMEEYVISRCGGEGICIDDSIHIVILPTGKGRAVRIGITAPQSVRILRAELEDSEIIVPERGWPRRWALMACLIPTQLRRSVWEPAYCELVEDYLEATQYFCRPRELQYLKVIYTGHAVKLLAETAFVGTCGFVKQTGAGFWRWFVGIALSWWFRAD